MAVERRPDARKFWIEVYSEQASLNLEGMELVVGDISTDCQFNALRRYCENYAQAAKAMFMERTTCTGELKAAEARVNKAVKVAGARKVQPEDSVSHFVAIRWPARGIQTTSLGFGQRVDNLPVDQRAAARSAKVIRRYVPSGAPREPLAHAGLVR